MIFPTSKAIVDEAIVGTIVACGTCRYCDRRTVELFLLENNRLDCIEIVIVV